MKDLFIHTAVLHILDFSGGLNVYSQQSLNLDDRTNELYVQRQLNKAIQDLRLKQGTFAKDSVFLEQMRVFKNHGINFTDYSRECAEYLTKKLAQLVPYSYDALFVSYSYEEVPYIAALLLENQKAFTHLSGNMNGMIVNQINEERSCMPSPSKKLNTYFLVNVVTEEIQYVDETDWNQGDTEVLKDLVLQCSSGQSKEEVFQEFQDVVDEVAEKIDVNSTMLLSKYKNYVRYAADQEEPLSTEKLAVHVFNESEEMQNTFLSASLEHELPKEVEIPKKVNGAKMKNQKIRTDTGIELTFPCEYAENPNMISFINQPDGTISIEIRNIGKIENKG